MPITVTKPVICISVRTLLSRGLEHEQAEADDDALDHLIGRADGARKLGHGVGYDYPHDDPRGWVPQEYRPPEVAGRVYYEPSEHGREREIGERMRARSGDRDQPEKT